MSWIILGIIISVIVVGAIALEVVSQEEESKAKDQDQDRLRNSEEQVAPVEPTPEPENQDNFPTTYYTGSLASDVGADYSRLRDLLAAKDYEAANRETFQVMLMVARRQKEGWFDTEDIERFPCTDLRTINQLWQHFSRGHFGFSIQSKVYQQVEGSYERFAYELGWREDQDWVNYVDLSRVNLVPAGYLPSVFASMTDAWLTRTQNCGL